MSALGRVGLAQEGRSRSSGGVWVRQGRALSPPGVDRQPAAGAARLGLSGQGGEVASQVQWEGSLWGLLSRDRTLSDFHSKRTAAEAKSMAAVLGRQRDGRMSRTRETEGRGCGWGQEVQDWESSALRGG